MMIMLIIHTELVIYNILVYIYIYIIKWNLIKNENIMVAIILQLTNMTHQ